MRDTPISDKLQHAAKASLLWYRGIHRHTSQRFAAAGGGGGRISDHSDAQKERERDVPAPFRIP
jgi:hypothetical protein